MQLLTLAPSPALATSIRATAQVFEDPKSRALLAHIQQVAPSEASVLIIGETGTGKELVARHIHNLSARRNRPFVAVNCGAFSESLVEAELFGHEKGAFTGALGAKAGWFEEADGGTLFLDEIGDLPLQVKLLKVIEESRFIPVGGLELKEVDVRIITATHHDLRTMVAEGRFRADLYYRLNVVPIHIPALRERPEEIQPLLDFYLAEFNQRYGRLLSWELEALDALTDYAWPGNIRELINLVERLVVTCSGERIELCDLPEEMRVARSDVDDLLPLRKQVENLERRLIRRALMQHKTTREAAKVLGMSQATLVQKMKRWEQG